MVVQVNQGDLQEAALAAAQIAEAAGGSSNVQSVSLPASTTASGPPLSVRAKVRSQPLTLGRLRSKPTSAKRVSLKRKFKKTRMDANLSPTEGPQQVHDQWALVDDDLNSSYAPCIPCREGCGRQVTSLQEADAHVQSAHLAPRVDQLPNLLPRGSLSLATPVMYVAPFMPLQLNSVSITNAVTPQWSNPCQPAAAQLRGAAQFSRQRLSW